MKILSEIKSRYKRVDNESLNKSERLIRRRIEVEEMRFKYYETFNAFISFEYKLIPVVTMAAVILFSILAFQLNNSDIAFYSIPLLIVLQIRKRFIRKAMRHRLRIEKHKIKKVLDTLDDQDKLPMDLFFWLVSARNFVNETGNFGVQ